MKAKKIIIRCILPAFALLFIFMITSCKKDKTPQINELHTTNVKKYGFAEYGNYVYSEWGRIYRFNRKTDTFLPACMDPECEGDCPVDCVMSYFAGIYDGRLYFCGWQQYTHKVFLAYQDVATGEVGVLKTLNEIEDSGGYYTFIENGYWYYKCKILKDGGDASDPNDYESYICRIKTDGTNDEAFIICEPGEAIIMVGSGKILTSLDGGIYSIDIESKTRNELFSYSANGYINAATPASYLNGKIYFLARSGMSRTSEYTNQTFQLNFLVWVDIESGESGKVIEEPVTSFCLTDDAIYYVPFKLRHIYVPEDYEEHPEEVTVCISDESLYVCDLNGKNSRVIYTNEKMDYAKNFTVIDNILYGWLLDYNEETHRFDKTFFGAIELETGRIIRTEKPE